LLKLQLCESQERENQFKKMSESVMNALKSESPSKLLQMNKNYVHIEEINEDHPKVREILINLKEEYSNRLQMERDKNKVKEN